MSAAAEKKLTRKELLKTPDEFLTLSEKAYNYVLENSTKVLIGVLAVVAAIALIVGFNYYRDYTAQKAIAAYDAAAAAIPAAGETDPLKTKAAVEALEKFVAEYPDSQAARFALLDLAALQSRQAQYQTAADYYQKVFAGLKPAEDHLRPMILDSLAYAYESMEKYDLAAETWEKILALPKDTLQVQARLSLGRVYLTLGQKDKAKAAYEALIAQAPDSPQAQLAKSKLSGL